MPDLNVLLALTLTKHGSRASAQQWYESEGKPELQVCRQVQLGFLRLLTTESVAGSAVHTNERAWRYYEALTDAGYVQLRDEPLFLDEFWKARAAISSVSPKRWADGYLAAFAEAAGLRLVTFDASLASYAPRSILLRS